MNLEPYDKLDLSDNLIKQIGNLVDGNQVKKRDVKPTENEVCLFQTELEITWSFEGFYDWTRRAGGQIAQNHFGYDRNSFDKHSEQQFNKAYNDRSLRIDFLNKLKKDAHKALTYSDQSHRIKELGRHSVCEQCGSCSGSGTVCCYKCNGSGKSQCISCNGSGKTTEYKVAKYPNGSSYTQSVNACCYSCGGAGKQTCTSCSGSGRCTCNKCNGCGYFTLTYDIWIKAIPEKQRV